nr:Hpt domain-containing protein [Desulfobulbaceae bacterium]
MIDNDAIQIFVEESAEHLECVENDLLSIEKGGTQVDGELINNIFRAVHTVKGGAGFLGFSTINTLAHKMENVMGLIRSSHQKPASTSISALLRAADTLKEMIHNLDASNMTDISAHIQALDSVIAGVDAVLPDTLAAPSVKAKKSTPLPENPIAGADTALPEAPKPEIIRDKESVQIFLEESNDHLEDIEADLLAMEKCAGEIDEELVNKVFRAVHTVKGGAGFLSYTAIKNLAHTMENVVGLIRERQLKATPEIITVLLGGADSLRDMVKNLDTSSETDISVQLCALESIVAGAPAQGRAAPTGKENNRVPEQHLPTVEEKSVVPEKSETPAKQQSHKQREVQPEQEPEAQAVKEQKADGSLRVNVRLLDQLMNLAGEMVLSRNQLVQAVSSKNMASIEQVKQRIDTVTSELQESVMFTRMQPIATVFNRFPRLIRELSMELGKEVELSIEGEDVELDKTILEAISAPLTHLIRNAIDHGIELPPERQFAHKDKKGKVILRANHEAGLVIIEVIDDGYGMSPEIIAAAVVKKGVLSEEQVRHLSDKEKLHLIFMPGFSTADTVTEISGRGVGMDVVKTNLVKLGGQIEIYSKPGKGTSIRIKLPLTLAIISAQIVICRNERYSIPQVNLEELLRIPAQDILDRVEIVGKAPVLKLRGTLLPLVKLVDVLGGRPVYLDEKTEETRDDRRQNLADRRALKTFFAAELQRGRRETRADGENDYLPFDKEKRKKKDRRYSKNSALYIAIVNTGNLKYGLVVDALMDAEEIVVKSLGRHLKSCKKYSGATIMGDGRVSLILDVGNIAREVGLISYEKSDRAKQLNAEMEAASATLQDKHSFLLFSNGGADHFCVPLNLVVRVIKIKSSEMEIAGGKRVLQYCGASLPLFSIDEVAPVPPLEYGESLMVIIFHVAGREVGLLATKPINAKEVMISVDDTTYQEPGIMGSVIIDGRITLLVNMHELVKIRNPQWFTHKERSTSVKETATILVADDSTFFQKQISKTLQEEGFNTIVAEDGQRAWEILTENADTISLLVTDIEMPRLNGFELTERVRDDSRFESLPIIAITTLAGEEDVKRGEKAGVNEYLVKFDRDQLVEKVVALL